MSYSLPTFRFRAGNLVICPSCKEGGLRVQDDIPFSTQKTAYFICAKCGAQSKVEKWQLAPSEVEE